MNVVVLDPAVENVNAGDVVISEAIAELPGLGSDDVVRLTTHRPLRITERRVISDADLVILGGTNALSSHMERFRQWLVDPDLFLRLRGKLVLLGVGWWQYQEPPCAYTRVLLRQLSSKEVPHSVRDNYTASRMSDLELPALMTGCPTMWGLDGAPQMPLGESSKAVITVTDYKRAESHDRAWIQSVQDHYEQTVCVGMGPGDEAYFRDLAIDGLGWAGTGTEALNSALPGSDFVGTRLHAGVRAMQMGRPALILGVDNRAAEISRDTGLRVVSRDDLTQLTGELDGYAGPNLALPVESIGAWTAGFTHARN